MRDIVKKILPTVMLQACRYIKFNMLDGYAMKSYSQEGEDMILYRIFEEQKSGFYIDIGAYHPKNTLIPIFFINVDGGELI
ncbi:MAG: hypothetical protein L3J17_05940 [Candidatus Jettenia sp.]|nr:MAG: hypothetical protein L3J17_05940 [Candidatus Jettenia sp.]